jgi:hypothetical protein
VTEVEDAVRTLWYFHHVYDDLIVSDVIIGLGSYDIRVALHCAELFHKGLAPRIAFTGAKGNWTRNLYLPCEAEVFQICAQEAGVPQEAITLEPRATNIGENIRFSADFVPEAKQAILVTKPQTQLRCQATAQKQWLSARALVTAPATALEDQPLPHHGKRALICEMVGDTERMRSYAQLGFQKEVDVPIPVLQAFNVLVEAGFVDHLIQPSSWR